MSQQAVFLFDLNAFPEAELHSDEALQRAITCLRVVCVRLLTEFFNQSQNFRFGMKFFDQRNCTQERNKNPLQEVNLETFENLEKKISDRYTRYVSYYRKLSQTELTQAEEKTNDKVKSPSTSPLKNLVTVLTEILYCYQWNSPEICSPVRSKRLSDTNTVRKNYVFLFSSCPMNIANFCGTDVPMSHSRLRDSLMPAALYKKFVTEAGITFVWIDTSEIIHNITSNENTLEVRQAIASAVTGLHGSFIPMQILSETYQTSEQNNEVQLESKEVGFPAPSRKQGLLLSFSQLFSYYISSPPVRQISNVWSCILVLPDNKNLNLILVPASHNNTSKSKQPGYATPKSMKRKKSITKKENQDPVCSPWGKLAVHGSVATGFFGVPDSLFFCHVSGNNSVTNESLVFTKVLSTLTSRNEYLVLNCETNNGDAAVGLLCPLTNLTAVIGIFNPLCPLLHSSPANKENSIFKALENLSLQDLESSLEYFLDQRVGQYENSALFPVCEKPFQSACMEKWFVPSSGVSKISKELQRPKSSAQKDTFFPDFMRKLQQEYRQEKKKERLDSLKGNSIRRSPRLKKLKNDGLLENSTSSQSISANCDSVCESSAKLHVICSVESDNKDKILSRLGEMYESAINVSGPLSLAHDMVNLIVTFLGSQKAPLLKEDLVCFLKENTFTTPQKIAELYEDRKDPESLAMKAKEYQMQVLLNMELEAVFPTSSSLDSVNRILALLRGMLFHVGHAKVAQFLRDYIRENYSHNLRHILLQIEEELNVTIVDHSASSSPGGVIVSPDYTTRSSTLSSITSCRSSSSVSSQKGCGSVKRAVLSQSTFSTSSLNRQILVPQELLKKARHKKHKQEPDAAKELPKVSSKNSDSSGSNTRNVRRNLFSTEAKSPTITEQSPPVFVRKKSQLTPKGRHVLKTVFVPETPSPKQGRSSVRIRQDRLRKRSGADTSVSVVAESPTFSKKAEGLKMHRNL